MLFHPFVECVGSSFEFIIFDNVFQIRIPVFAVNVAIEIYLSAGFLSVLVKGKKSGIFLPGCFKNGKNSTLQFLVVVQCKSDSNVSFSFICLCSPFV